MMGILSVALDSFSPDDIAKLIVQYGPAIEALVRFIELEKDEKKRALSMDAITRGLQSAKQTGDTTQLMDAVRSHCTSVGCLVA